MYQPNTSRKDIQRRIKIALDFVEQYHGDVPRPSSQSQINKYFTAGANPINRWLRDKLLICVDDYWNFQTHQCKKYVINRQGVKELKALINAPSTTPILTARQEQELVTGNFTYNLSGDRFYNGLQNLRKEVRMPLLASHGMPYHYDIVCAAPTLILQYAVQLGLTKTTPALDRYIHHRQAVRDELASALELRPDDVKRIIHALLHGASISRSYMSSIWTYVNYDSAKIAWLQQDAYFTELHQDIKQCWKTIKSSMPQRTITDSRGVVRSKRLSGRDKSGIYRSLEKSVMDSVYKFLKKNKNKFFKEHDGFTCEEVIDQNSLRRYVKEATGFVIDFDYTKYTYVDTHQEVLLY
jgi:hypothetical protein